MNPLLSFLLFFSFYLVCFNTTYSFALKGNALSKENTANFYISDFKEIKESMNENNYEDLVYNKVCSHMNQIHSPLFLQSLNSTKKKQILTELVKVYGRVLDFSEEHYLMYCIYDHYQSPQPEELEEISKKILSSEKQKQFNDMFDLCHQENIKGNGDDPLLKPFDTQSSSKLLPVKVYRKLSAYFQKSYIKKIKEYFLQFEQRAEKELSIPRENTEQSLEKSSMGTKGQSFLLELFFPYVFANSFKNRCLIGGVFQEISYSKRLKRNSCSVWGRECNGSKNNFQCGAVFNNKCIPINPVRSISKRCYQVSKDDPVLPDFYKDYKNSVESILDEYCSGRRKNRVSCRLFRERVEQANQEYRLNLEENQDGGSLLDEQTEAGAVCLDCLQNQSPQFKDMQKISEIILKIKKEREFMDYFSDTIFDHTSCRCTGNDGCTRGCKSRRSLEKGDSSPPITRCYRRKSRGRSTANCMKHVTGAIMNSVHKFLAPYCEDVTKNKADYEQCIDEFQADSSHNICQNGLVFPSALCAINLDGKGSNAMYKKIKNQRVKNNCKRWNKFNKSLLSIELKQDDGSLKSVPLFQKIPLDSLKSKGKLDMNKIPKGAIIVSSSASKHGHVEIKTGNKECSKKGVKGNETCFCSDFCRSRKDYKKEGLKAQAVFQWNPEIIKYINNNSD